MLASAGPVHAWSGPAAPLAPPLPPQLIDLAAAACVEPGYALWAAAGCPRLDMVSKGCLAALPGV